MKKKTSGFTVIELLVVLVVVSVLMGAVFPLGSQLRKKALLLSKKTDALRFQAAFMDYFQQYHHYPECFPIDSWFDLSLCFQKFIKEFSGNQSTKDNPESIQFCTFTAQELATSKVESMHFFLCIDTTPLQASQVLDSKKEIFGTRVLFYVD